MQVSHFCSCCRAMHKRGLRSRVVSVCLSVTFVYFVETSKHRQIFLTIASHTILPNVMAVFRWRAPKAGLECRWGTQKSRFSTNIWLHRVLSTLRLPSVIHTAALDRDKLVTLIAGNRRRLLFAGEGRRRSVYAEKPQRYTKDNRIEFNCTQS